MSIVDHTGVMMTMPGPRGDNVNVTRAWGHVSHHQRAWVNIPSNARRERGGMISFYAFKGCNHAKTLPFS